MQFDSPCLQEIYYLNLSYLLLIQNISRRNEHIIHTDINPKLVKVLQRLPLSKLVSLAETNQLLITLKPDIMEQQLDERRIGYNFAPDNSF
ncbi:flagellar transcriptional regulator FlhD [Lelliottia nimipressuralis]